MRTHDGMSTVDEMDAISITGLQGTGKTTLAAALGRAIGAVVFSRDPLMDVLHADGVPLEPAPGAGLKSYPEIGHDLQTALLRTQLELGQSVILECVVGAEMRARWRRVAARRRAPRSLPGRGSGAIVEPRARAASPVQHATGSGAWRCHGAPG